MRGRLSKNSLLPVAAWALAASAAKSPAARPVGEAGKTGLTFTQRRQQAKRTRLRPR